MLGKRSYCVYRLRTDENKSFREIGTALGLTGGRARQLYEEGIKRIELAKSGGEIHPEYCLSVRALHCIERALEKTDATKREIVHALKSGKLHPDNTYSYGWKTHSEVCAWAGVSPGRR